MKRHAPITKPYLIDGRKADQFDLRRIARGHGVTITVDTPLVEIVQAVRRWHRVEERKPS